MARYISPVPQYFDAAGDPLALGKLFFFISGTNDPLETFADVNEETPNTQPVLLTGDGRVPNIFFSGSAKVILTDSDDVQIWSRDPVTTGGSSGSIGDDWNAITIYNEMDIVDFSGVLYVSIVNTNQNNNPATSPESWTQFDLLKRWNINESYSLGDPVTIGGLVYISSIDSNLANNPTSDLVGNWTGGFSGALAICDNTLQTFAAATPTAVDFQAETYDTNDFHDNVVNNQRQTIPAGVNLVSLSAQIDFSTNGAVILTIVKNGVTDVAKIDVISGSLGLSVPDISVVAGDFFEVYINSTAGTSITNLTFADCFFAIKVTK